MITAEGVAWFLMGEGSLGICIQRNKECLLGYRTFPEVTVTNTEIDLLNEVRKWLSKNKIPASLNQRSPKTKTNPHHRDSFIIHIAGFKPVRLFLDAISPYLIGNKKKQAELILNYIKRFSRREGYYNHRLKEEQKRFLEILKIHDEVLALQGHGATKRRKYTRQLFEKLFAQQEQTKTRDQKISDVAKNRPRNSKGRFI